MAEDEQADEPVDRRPDNFHTKSLAILVFLPTSVFAVISGALTFSYHSNPGHAYLVMVMCFGISVVFMMVPRTRSAAPSYWFNMGVLCLVACLTGLGAAFSDINRHMSMYWLYEGQRMSTNVHPSEPAVSHLDAGKIVFSDDARLDFPNAFAYGSKPTYCVVPVVGDASTKAVQYWAAGVNCCTHGNFTCDAATNREAHAGLVYVEELYEDVLRSFHKAIRKAGVEKKLKLEQEPLFVQWVVSPTQAQRSYYNAGVKYYILSVVLYLVSSVFVALCMHFGQRKQWDNPKLASKV